MTGAQQDFPVLLPQLEPIQGWLLAWCGKGKLDEAVTQQLSLIAEELFVNLVTYGTAPSSSQARFALSADCRSVCLEMLDCGGLRFYLIRNSAEKTEYSRAAGHNRARVWLARQQNETPLRSSI